MTTQRPFIIILIAFLVLGLLSDLFGQSKKDSIKFDSTEVRLIARNALIIQQQLHVLHLDAVLRDKLDSVYNQSAALLENKLKKKPVKNK